MKSRIVTLMISMVAVSILVWAMAAVPATGEAGETLNAVTTHTYVDTVPTTASTGVTAPATSPPTTHVYVDTVTTTATTLPSAAPGYTG